MKNLFISYNFGRQEKAKRKLVKEINKRGVYFKIRNSSVEVGDISDELSDREIFKIIRQKYLKDSDTTVVLLGRDTGSRKIIDWEIAASLSAFGSVSGRGQTNSLIILLTKDFMKTIGKKPCLFADKDITSSSKYYSSFVTLENSGPRIFDNVKNGFAVVDYFENVINNINRLDLLINKAENNLQTIEPSNALLQKQANDKKISNIESETEEEEDVFNLKQAVLNDLYRFVDNKDQEQEVNKDLDNEKQRRNTINFG